MEVERYGFGLRNGVVLSVSLCHFGANYLDFVIFT